MATAAPETIALLDGAVIETVGVAGVTVKGSPFTPLNVTAVTPVKSVPLIVTMVPTGPLVGVKLVIVGFPSTVRLTAGAVAVLPAASRATAVSVCTPMAASAVFQLVV